MVQPHPATQAIILSKVSEKYVAAGGYEQEVSMARQRWREDGTASAGDAANARANS